MNKLDFYLLAAAACALALASGLAGYRVGSAQVERLERQRAEEVAAVANAATKGLLLAEKQNDALAAQVAAAENDLARTLQEKTDALNRLATGRRCLDAAVVRVLNDERGTPPDPLPEAGSEPVSAAARFATDADVGRWAIACRSAYDTCRGRLDAVRRFYEFSPEATGDSP